MGKKERLLSPFGHPLLKKKDPAFILMLSTLLATAIVTKQMVGQEEKNDSGILQDITILINQTGYATAAMVLIPPNGKITNIERIEGTRSIAAYGEVFYRCYKFAYVIFNVTFAEFPPYGNFSQERQVLKLTISPDGPLMPYVSCDELVDPSLEFLKTSKNMDLLVQNACRYQGCGDNFFNLKKASDWKAYPQYQINETQLDALPNGTYQYVAVCPSEWASTIAPLLSYKEARSIKTYLATTEWITSHYGGRDAAEKIREFIKDAFCKWHIQYVLLCGGAEAVPTRKIDPWTSYYPETGYTDRYYMNLDGNWDDDNDGRFGETIVFGNGTYKGEAFQLPLLRETDWLPEVVVGRLPAVHLSDLEVMVNKTLHYETDPPELNGLLEIFGKAVFYRTFDFPYLNKTFLYYQSLWFGSNFTSTDQIGQYLEEGQLFLHVNTHARSDGWGFTGFIDEDPYFGCEDAAKLDNGLKLPIVVADGCDTASFAAGDSSLAVQMLKNPNGGAVAYFGSILSGTPLATAGIFGFLMGGQVPCYLGHSQSSGLNFIYPSGTSRPAVAWFQEQVLEGSLWLWHDGYAGSFLGDPEIAVAVPGPPQPPPVTFSPDLNMDGIVNIVDIAIVAKAFGSEPGDPAWNELADLDRNGTINILDISAVAKDYGKTV